MRKWLSIVGIGEDGLAGVSAVARTLIAQAEVLVGGDVTRQQVAEAAEAALTELRVDAHRQHKRDQRRQEQDNGPPPSHEASLPFEAEK